MNGSDRVQVIAYGDDPLEGLAGHLLDRHVQELPFLNRHAVLFPTQSCTPRFRHLLLNAAVRRGMQALIPPWTGTIHQWASQTVDVPKPVLSHSAREILLYKAIIEQPVLSQYTDPWALVDNLLELFDALTMSRHLVALDFTDFHRQLSEAYRLNGAAPSQLDSEARLVHELWQIWQGQLAALELRDPIEAYSERLSQSLQTLNPEIQIYLAGFTHLSDRELEWLKALQARSQAHLIIHGHGRSQGDYSQAPVSDLLTALERPPGPSQPTGDYARFLEHAFAIETGDMPHRAQQLIAVLPCSPAAERLAVFEAADAEQEAHAIDVQIRTWWLEGKRNIGIVTNDRKLARRVRALLERANILIQDAAGWRLSTTSAAAALMRWLDSVENDFFYEPLMDLLKSPFIEIATKDLEQKKLIACFEREVVLHQNCFSTMSAYRTALQKRSAAIEEKYNNTYPGAISTLLDALEQAGNALKPLLDNRAHAASDWLNALYTSLSRLGMIERYRHDDAGLRLLEQLDDMQEALSDRTIRLSWRELRRWLARNLERHNFQPPLDGRDVELMGFVESRLYQFDALVIAGATAEHLPGSDALSPFFNDAVRRQLKLPTSTVRRDSLFHDFRRLLEAATTVLITLRREQDSEPMAPSPWLERVRIFHQLVYGDRLDASSLTERVTSPDTWISASGSVPLPKPETHPAPRVPVSLIPSRVSASAHQRILDCPYQYFSHDCLGLGPVPEFREELEKKDYGERVHRILRAFHSDVPGLPGPFQQPLTSETLPAAQTLLIAISEIVFADDIKHSFMARGWLYRWHTQIAGYLRWQLQRARAWRVLDTEVELEAVVDVDGPLRLNGRIDRIDAGEDGYAVLDYKTGQTPEKAEVITGEQIQLPFYALLWPKKVEHTLFVKLEQGRINTGIGLEGTHLQELSEQVEERLIETTRALRAGKYLPAWGDATTCRQCTLEGLCRKQMWQNEPRSV